MTELGQRKDRERKDRERKDRERKDRKIKSEWSIDVIDTIGVIKP